MTLSGLDTDISNLYSFIIYSFRRDGLLILASEEPGRVREMCEVSNSAASSVVGGGIAVVSTIASCRLREYFKRQLTFFGNV